jgi:hypothetical protein
MTKVIEAEDSRLLERAEVIARTILSQQQFYNSQDITFNQRQLLETMIGASIWYLPQSGDLWTGAISHEALSCLALSAKPKSVKLTKDHNYPRKVAAAELLALDWSKIENKPQEVADRYLRVYGKFNYVLPEENKKLVKYQKTHNFISSAQSYEDAGIKLHQLSSHILKAILAGDTEIAKMALSDDID